MSRAVFSTYEVHRAGTVKRGDLARRGRAWHWYPPLRLVPGDVVVVRPTKMAPPLAR